MLYALVHLSLCLSALTYAAAGSSLSESVLKSQGDILNFKIPTSQQILTKELDQPEHKFVLKHILHHGTYRHPDMLRWIDVDPSRFINQRSPAPLPLLTAVKSQPKNIQRLKDRRKDTIETYLHHQRHDTLHLLNEPLVWTKDEINMPDISDRETVATLAKMTADAYIQIPNTEDWQEVGRPWNSSHDFGWEDDGLRGHVFLDEANTTIVMSLKGTTPAVFDGAETTTNDKINDNLLFSCCCARVSAFWKTVCDCYTNTYSCSNVCLKKAITAENRYYRAALNLYHNITHIYPDKDVWVVGHSLGGSVSSLLGATYGLPVVTFEAPGEALASQRIGLPLPPKGTRVPGMSGAFHFGNNADPIYMGVCNGATSFCSIGGYAMETRCHTGNVCLYDVVNDFGWRPGLGYHKIKVVIGDIILKYDKAAKCIPEDEECTDCFNWKYHNNDTTTSTTTSSTSTSTTRTSTCQHPGWWGCLDETTTLTSTSTTSHVSMTSSAYTTNPKQTSSTQSTATTTTCLTPGYFFGCRDLPPATTSVFIDMPHRL